MRVLRRITIALRAGLLLAALAVVALWVRSYYVGDALQRSRFWLAGEDVRGEVASVEGTNGQVVWGLERIVAPPGTWGAERAGLVRSPARGPEWEWLRSPHPEASREFVEGFAHWGPVGWRPDEYVEYPGGNRGGPGVQHRIIFVAAPHWLIALALGLWPGTSLLLAWRRRTLRRRLDRVGHCRGCGYDLRATPDGGGALLSRCPECGRTAEARAGADGAVAGNGG